jgi:hypothetical protein
MIHYFFVKHFLRECRRMLRLLVGDECDQIRVQVTIGHPETVYCHSEESRLSGTPQNDIQMPGFRMDSTQ